MIVSQWYLTKPLIMWAKAIISVYADSTLCIGRMVHEPGAAEQRWKGQMKILKGIFRNKTQWDSMEKQLKSSGQFSHDF